MIVDLGTGDGRAVVARAAAEPQSLVIGIDANAAAMAESSRRTSRGRDPSGRNALFLVHAAEALPGPLAGVANLVTITMPWGSLLRGVLGLDPLVLGGIASIVTPGGAVEILASVTPADSVPGLAALDWEAASHIAAAWAAVGFELVSMQPVTPERLAATRSAWARRLGGRPVWWIELARHVPSDPDDSSDRST